MFQYGVIVQMISSARHSYKIYNMYVNIMRIWAYRMVTLVVSDRFRMAGDNVPATSHETRLVTRQHIAEELQSQTLQATLDQCLGYIFHPLVASLSMFHPESSRRGIFELPFHNFGKKLCSHQLEDIITTWPAISTSEHVVPPARHSCNLLLYKF